MEFIELPRDKRSKYPALLQEIREATTSENEEQWVKLSTFPNVDSARDTASRLKAEHVEFEFTSRKNDDGVSGTVYVRYIGELL